MNFDSKKFLKEKVFDIVKLNIYLFMENKMGNYKIKEKYRFVNRLLY